MKGAVRTVVDRWSPEEPSTCIKFSISPVPFNPDTATLLAAANVCPPQG